MTKDNIIQMAREAGISDTNFDFQMVSPEDLERFAALVAAAEREVCAKVCESGWKSGVGAKYQGDVFAAAIRARGDA